MTPLAWILLFSLIGGVLSVILASVFLLLSDAQRARVLPHLVSFATGALLGAAFLALLPHALEHPAAPEAHTVTLAVLVGLLVFFVLEKLVLWRHCHTGECDLHGPSEEIRHSAAGSLVLVGDAIHNLVDGVLIAAAFLTDTQLGIVTAVAVAAHEIPQEVGDFVILLHSGFSRRRALIVNVLTSLTTVLGGMVAYFSLRDAEALLPFVLAVAAAGFIYVAVADLIPSLHRRVQPAASLQQVGLILVGVAVIALAHTGMH